MGQRNNRRSIPGCCHFATVGCRSFLRLDGQKSMLWSVLWKSWRKAQRGTLGPFGQSLGNLKGVLWSVISTTTSQEAAQ